MYIYEIIVLFLLQEQIWLYGSPGPAVSFIKCCKLVHSVICSARESMNSSWFLYKLLMFQFIFYRQAVATNVTSEWILFFHELMLHVHSSHLNGLYPSWTDKTCSFMLPFEKSYSHRCHIGMNWLNMLFHLILSRRAMFTNLTLKGLLF